MIFLNQSLLPILKVFSKYFNNALLLVLNYFIEMVTVIAYTSVGLFVYNINSFLFYTGSTSCIIL